MCLDRSNSELLESDFFDLFCLNVLTILREFFAYSERQTKSISIISAGVSGVAMIKIEFASSGS